MSDHAPHDEPTLPDGTGDDDLFDLDTPPVVQVGGRYTLEERLGTGGGAVVWRAFDEVLGRTVAVKLLRTDRARDDAAVDRLRREASMAARTPHPGIVGVYDAGTTTDGTVWIALEHVEGPTLLEALRHHPAGLPPRTAAAIAEQAAAALAEAHAHGLVHRDVKPANLLLSHDGVVKIADFGIAAPVHDPSAGDDDRGPTPDAATRSFHGTPSYAAPEQLRGRPDAAAPQADVFSLGVVLHESLTGRPAFERGGRDPDAQPLPPSRIRADIPRALDRVVTAATSTDPARRPADGHDLAIALRPLVDADPHALVAGLVARVRRDLAPQDAAPTAVPDDGSARRRPSLWIAAAGLALLVTVGLLTQLAVRGDRGEPTQPVAADAGLPLSAVRVFDPYGSIGPAPVDPLLAVDGDPSTAWSTPSYPVPLRSLGTPGVGIWVDLGAAVAVEELDVHLRTGGVTLELLASDTSPTATTTEADWDSLDRAEGPGQRVQLRADGHAARYWLVWFTELEPVGEAWQAALTDIRFRPVEQ